ncbi:MAG: RNA polymerase sigma factor [Cellulosilyticaceae bacterium]
MKELAILCKELYPSLIGYFLSELRNYDLAEELTQETLYQACKSKPSFKGHSSLKTWVFSIARFTLLNYYKKTKTLTSDYTLDTYTPSAEHTALMNEDYRQLLLHINALNDTERQIVLLRGYADLDFASIGYILNLKENYCRVIYCRSRQKLQQLMEKEVHL